MKYTISLIIIVLIGSSTIFAQKHFMPSGAKATASEHTQFMQANEEEALKRAGIWKVPVLAVQLIASVQSGAGVVEGFNYGGVQGFPGIIKFEKFTQIDPAGYIICSKRSRGFEAIAIALRDIQTEIHKDTEGTNALLGLIFGPGGELHSMALEAEKAYHAYTQKTIIFRPTSSVENKKKKIIEGFLSVDTIDATEKTVLATSTLTPVKSDTDQINRENEMLQLRIVELEEEVNSLALELEREREKVTKLRQQEIALRRQHEEDLVELRRTSVTSDVMTQSAGQIETIRAENNKTDASVSTNSKGIERKIEKLQQRGWVVVGGIAMGNIINKYQENAKVYGVDYFDLPILTNTYFGGHFSIQKNFPSNKTYVYGFSGELGLLRPRYDNPYFNEKNVRIHFRLGGDVGYMFNLEEEQEDKKIVLGARGYVNLSPNAKMADEDGSWAWKEIPYRLDLAALVRLQLTKIAVELNAGARSQGIIVGFQF